MERLDSSGIVTGVACIIIGIGLLILSFFFIFVLLYALPAIIIGIVILLTLKEQETIEKIKKGKEIKRSVHNE